MFPSFSVFGKEFSMYVMMALVGALAMFVMLLLNTRKPIYRRDQWLHLILAAAAGAIVVAHLFYFFTRLHILSAVLADPGRYITSFKNVLSILSMLFGGMVYYGGLFGGLFGAWLYSRKHRIDFGLHLDAATPGIPLFHMFGRIGCFCGGCCYGVPSEKYGVIFSGNPFADHTVKYFPIQLVEAGLNFFFFLILLVLFKKEIAKGKLIWIYLSVYAVMRFVLEFWRGDTIRGIYAGFSTSQWISAALLLFCIGYFVRSHFHAKKAAQVVVEESWSRCGHEL